MQRFLVDFPLSDRLRVDDPDLVHQMSRVLRMRPGDECAFVPGDGTEHLYAAVSFGKAHAEFERREILPAAESGLPAVTLVQALPNRLEKLEFLLQKGVEGGIAGFAFFTSERSQPLPALEKKKDRLRSIAKEAAEQSGARRMPEIAYAKALPPAAPGALRLVADTVRERVRLADVPRSPAYELCVGPEGGWSDAERALFRAEGATFVDLGDRVLRTETAGTVAAFFLRQR